MAYFNDTHRIFILKISIGLTLYVYRCTRIIARDLLTLRPSNPRENRRCKSLDTHPSCWRSCTCSGALGTRTVHRISCPLKRPGATTVPRWTWKKFRKITAARAIYFCRLQVEIAHVKTATWNASIFPARSAYYERLASHTPEWREYDGHEITGYRFMTYV